MLSETDMKILKRHQTFAGKAVEWIVIAFPVGLVIMANLNLVLSANLAAGAGESFGKLVGVWLEGFESGVRYEGSFIASVELFKAAIMQAASALVMAGMAWMYISNQRMNGRLLAEFEATNRADTDDEQGQQPQQ
jgi:hypothetical protein